MKVRQAMLTHREVKRLLAMLEEGSQQAADKDLYMKLYRLERRFVGRDEQE